MIDESVVSWQEDVSEFVHDRMNERAQNLLDDDSFLFAASGLAQEAAEVLGSVTKNIFGKPQSRSATASELADVLFYLIRLCELYHVTFLDLERILRDKLKDGHGWKK